MNIKEKAEAYDGLIERLKDLKFAYRFSPLSDTIEEKFPELKESEGESADEKVRKALIKLVTNHASMDLFIEYDIHLDEALSWLEKQGKNNMGISESTKQNLEDNLNKALEKETPESWNEFLDEQKPADKIEPKFKAGDWAVSKFDGKARQISEVHYDEYNNYYVVGSHEYDIEEYDRLHHLWTIKDAKAGDVLSYRDGQWCFIYKGIVTEDTFKYYALLSEKGITVNDAAFSLLASCIIPATKEQCNLLFQKMKEAGYVWDAEKKELRKIEQEENIELTDFESALFSAFSYAWQEYLSGKEVNVAKWAREHSAELLEVAREQKPACTWSKEDENITCFLIDVAENYRIRNGFSSVLAQGDKAIDWLNSLREKYTWKPSDAQMKALSDMNLTGGVSSPKQGRELITLYNDLKKLK